MSAWYKEKKELEENKNLYELFQYWKENEYQEQLAINNNLACVHYNLIKCPITNETNGKKVPCGLDCYWKFVRARNPDILAISLNGQPKIKFNHKFSTELSLRGGVYKLFAIIYYSSHHYWTSYLKEGSWFSYDDIKRNGSSVRQSFPPTEKANVLLYQCVKSECVYTPPVVTEDECRLPESSYVDESMKKI